MIKTKRNIKKKRVVTKKHKFNWEIKYKNLFNIDEEFTTNIFDLIIRNIDDYGDETDTKTITEFLVDYSDLILDWEKFISDRYFYLITSNENNIDFIDALNQHFDERAWSLICYYLNENVPNSEKIIMKYKDKLTKKDIDTYVSVNRCSIKFIKNVKDLIDMRAYIYGEIDPYSPIAKLITTYAMDHIEEILTYKTEVNWDEID